MLLNDQNSLIRENLSINQLPNTNNPLGDNNQFILIDTFQQDYFSDDDVFQQDHNYVEYDDTSHYFQNDFNCEDNSHYQLNDNNNIKKTTKNKSKSNDTSQLVVNYLPSTENNDFLDDDENDSNCNFDDFDFMNFRSSSNDKLLLYSSNIPENHKNNQMKENLRRLSSQKKVELSDDECDFKYNFYQILTSKKRFAKTIVRDIHNYMSKNYFKFQKMTRNQFRNIDLYFHDYSKYKEQILIYLKNNKELILKSIQGLNQDQ